MDPVALFSALPDEQKTIVTAGIVVCLSIGGQAAVEALKFYFNDLRERRRRRRKE